MRDDKLLKLNDFHILHELVPNSIMPDSITHEKGMTTVVTATHGTQQSVATSSAIRQSTWYDVACNLPSAMCGLKA